MRVAGAEKWSRQLSYGRVVSNVLVINRGLALLRTEIQAIAGVSELEIGDGPKKPEAALGRLLTFDDGSVREVAVGPADVARFDAVSAKPQSPR